jgi:hypothetical protein
MSLRKDSTPGSSHESNEARWTHRAPRLFDDIPVGIQHVTQRTQRRPFDHRGPARIDPLVIKAAVRPRVFGCREEQLSTSVEPPGGGS